MDFWVDGCHGVKMVDGGEWFGTRFFFFLIIFLGGGMSVLLFQLVDGLLEIVGKNILPRIHTVNGSEILTS